MNTSGSATQTDIYLRLSKNVPDPQNFRNNFCKVMIFMQGDKQPMFQFKSWFNSLWFYDKTIMNFTFFGQTLLSMVEITFLPVGQFLTSWSCDQNCLAVKNVISTRNITFATENVPSKNGTFTK